MNRRNALAILLVIAVSVHYLLSTVAPAMWGGPHRSVRELMVDAANDGPQNLIDAFQHSTHKTLRSKHVAATERGAVADWRTKARLAVAALHLGDDRIAADMCRIEDRPDPVQRTVFIDEFPRWHGNLGEIALLAASIDDPGLCSALCLGIGSIAPEQLTAEARRAVQALLSDWYQTQSEASTHSAAGWALRHWNVALPPLGPSSEPREENAWYVNSIGMTMLEIPGGTLRRPLSEFTGFNYGQPVIVDLQAFFLGDREFSTSQFRQFIDDATCPAADKPTGWSRRATTDARTADYPVDSVSWYDVVLCCNWLSRKEGRSACYRRTEGKENGTGAAEHNAWHLIEGASGYRLPTEAEWEYACRAGTSTVWGSGSDAELLQKYAVVMVNSPDVCGTKLPNGFGAFDMHGNVWEWCHDLYNEEMPWPDACSTSRPMHGGDWSDTPADVRPEIRSGSTPDGRYRTLGFRLARSSVR